MHSELEAMTEPLITAQFGRDRPQGLAIRVRNQIDRTEPEAGLVLGPRSCKKSQPKDSCQSVQLLGFTRKAVYGASSACYST